MHLPFNNHDPWHALTCDTGATTSRKRSPSLSDPYLKHQTFSQSKPYIWNLTFVNEYLLEATAITIWGWRFYNFLLFLTSFKPRPLDAWCDLYVLCMYCAVYIRSTFYWQHGSTHIVTYKLHAVRNMKVKFLQCINSLIIQCRKPALRSPRFLRSALRYYKHIYSDQNAKKIKRLYYFEDLVNDREYVRDFVA